MAVLFVEGFTGVPRAQSNAASSQLPALGWALRVRYNGTSVAESNNAYQLAIEADPVFAARNQLTYVSTAGQYTNFAQLTQNLDTSGYQKFVIGLTVTARPGASTSAAMMHLYLSGTTLFTNSGGSFPTSDIFCDLAFPVNGSDGTATAPMTGQTMASPLIKANKETHVEAFIEQDVDRCRIYVDGNLVLDYSYTGTFASATGGFSVVLGKSPAGAGADNITFANCYLLGCDTIHPGRLGPSARVLETPPSSDVAVQFGRPDAYSSNSAVLQQMFNATDPDYLFTGDPVTDLYAAPSTLPGNAAQVFGAAMKVNAMTMASGTHHLTGAVRYGTTDATGPTSFILPTTLKPLVLDVSKNPETNLRWTPSQLVSAGVGFKLVD